jgi:hypothetical protein
MRADPAAAWQSCTGRRDIIADLKLCKRAAQYSTAGRVAPERMEMPWRSRPAQGCAEDDFSSDDDQDDDSEHE